jgi:hypothetical protein
LLSTEVACHHVKIRLFGGQQDPALEMEIATKLTVKPALGTKSLGTFTPSARRLVAIAQVS